MEIRMQQFSGMVPKTSGELLPDYHAQLADGCTLRSGKIEPLKKHLAVASVPAGTKSIFLHNGEWMSWANDVDIVKSPVVDDAYDRLYWTGDAFPAISGMIDGARKRFRLGVPAPDAPNIELLTTPKDGVRWRVEWKYQYEEPDGTVSDEGNLYTNSESTESIEEMLSGYLYQISTVPEPGDDVTDEAVFCIYFDAYMNSDIGTYLGRCYSDKSLYTAQNSCYLNGAKITLVQSNNNSSPECELLLVYDGSDASDNSTERSYVLTFLSAFGEESAPCDPSDLIAVLPTQDVVVTGLPTEAPDGYENIVSKRLYRTVSSSAGTYYQMVDDISLEVESYLDYKTDAELLTVLETADWNPPPDGMLGLCVNANGVGAGFTDDTLYLSEPYRLHAWPAKYEFQIKSKVVSVKPSGTSFVVLTTDEPEIISGDTPDSMRRTRIAVKQGCASKRSAVVFQGGVVYCTPDGVGMISTGYIDLSSDFYTRNKWQELKPETALAAVHDNMLLIYCDNGSLIASLDDQLLVSDSASAPDAFYQDADNDALYFCEGGSIWKWRGGEEPITARWRSRVYLSARPIAPIEVQVQAAGYPVELRFIADGEVVKKLTLTDSKVRKVPVMRRNEKWAYEVETLHRIDQLYIQTVGGSL
jgi:hypothetical protein